MRSSFLARANAGRAPLWTVWWLLGLPLAGAAGTLLVVAERWRLAGHHGWGDGADVARLMLYLAWALLVWRCSRNVVRRVWTFVSRLATLAGGTLMVLV